MYDQKNEFRNSVTRMLMKKNQAIDLPKLFNTEEITSISSDNRQYKRVFFGL